MYKAFFWAITLCAMLGAQTANVSTTKYGCHMDLMWNGDPSSRTTAINRATQLNATVSRNSLLWHLIEPQKGIRDWSRVDAVVDELARNNIEPLLVVLGSPSWANGTSSSVSDSYFYVPKDSATFNTWVQQYTSFVTEAVSRYKGRVKKWELWNEENEHYFWKPQPDATQYATWYRAVYSVIKQGDPSAQIALGGLAGLAASGPIDYNGNQFVKEMYSRGVTPDIIAIHPYALQWQSPDVTIQWNNNFTDIQLIHDTMTSYGQGDKKLWVTEWGWPTDQVSEGTQATYVAASLNMIATKYPFVSVATYFVDYDRPPEYFFGLYDSNGRMKPAGQAFRDFAAANRSSIQVSITPPSISLSAGQSVQVAASVTGTTNVGVTWSLSQNIGSLSGSGVYVAPSAVSAPETVQIIATSMADPSKSATSTVSIAPVVTISVSPNATSLFTGKTVQLTASVTGTSNIAVTWSLSSPVGTISASGLFVAPLTLTAPQTIQVTATSVADPNKKAIATVSITPVVAISVTPSASSLSAGQNLQLAAAVTGTTNTAVKWSLSSAIGSISTSGLYTSPASVPAQQTVQVIATSVADPSKSAATVLNIVPVVAISVAPNAPSLVAGQNVQLTASVIGTTNTAVKWSLGSPIGSVSATGYYVSPAPIASQQTVQVIATSAFDPSKSAAALICISPVVGLSVTPKTASLMAGQSLPLTVSFTGTTNTAVKWSLSVSIGSISAAGVYVAPASIAMTQTIQIIATSVADPTKSASMMATLTPTAPSTYLSDLQWTSASSGWGPVERNMSNGENGSKDGRTLSIRGVTYAKGLGVHQPSEIHFSMVGRTCTTLLSDVGIDDETRGQGSVDFQVWADGVKLYDSGVMKGTTPANRLKVELSGKKELVLIVADIGDGMVSDHADWAGARLSCSGQ